MTDGSLVDVWQFTVVIVVGAVAMGALESRVKDQRTAFVVALLCGFAAAFLTPLPRAPGDALTFVLGRGAS